MDNYLQIKAARFHPIAGTVRPAAAGPDADLFRLNDFGESGERPSTRHGAVEESGRSVLRIAEVKKESRGRAPA
jgi:hypothetical protein